MSKIISFDSLAHLDYRFGWRWLVPISENVPISVLGFDNSEIEFWQKVYPKASFIHDQSNAEVLILNGQAVDSFGLISSETKIVCVLGSRNCIGSWQRALQTWASVHCFGLLPIISPRVVIPLVDGRSIREGLHLYRPGRRIARIAVKLIAMLSYLGFRSSIDKRQLLIALRNSSDSTGVCALYLGNPEPNRKTTILPLENGKETEIVIKYAQTLEARTALIQEYNALRTLSGSSVSAQIPAIRSFTEDMDSCSLAIEYRKRNWASKRKIRENMLGFLSKLSSEGRRTRPLVEVIEQCSFHQSHTTWKCSWPAYEVAHRYLKLQAAKGIEVIVHRSHGDFSPWNCSWTNEGFFVFDWEDSQEGAIALSDSFYYVVAPYLHLPGSIGVKKTQQLAVETGNTLAERIGINPDEVLIYWILWLVEKFQTNEMNHDSLGLLLNETFIREDLSV